jgi:small-conductance mechanosensitive channel
MWLVLFGVLIAATPSILEFLSAALIGILKGIVASLLAILVVGIVATLVEYFFDVKFWSSEGENGEKQYSWKF